ncbi:uncharacterized protein SCHCODRAFT_02642715 [Schizophyllum commune H4-8]|uniref:uncharacterized protein n=1 Tax=Schizophyllum commune (strain H4-8 / FGSC 9210) TaxID=578458 RepID=UPI00215E3C5E|nr:uncharacterized protein SCHCODRAFT_02642715 [Schizophyllum commune H4-8]KAI5885882.1 hypothetical protein SCHCODRAFT_02642715 [Schizophyllum commune H4-8]
MKPVWIMRLWLEKHSRQHTGHPESIPEGAASRTTVRSKTLIALAATSAATGSRAGEPLRSNPARDVRHDSCLMRPPPSPGHLRHQHPRYAYIPLL